MGSNWLYASGDLFFPASIRKFLETFLIGSYDSYIYITYWSILHFVSGILVATLLLKNKANNILLKGFLLHTLWEVWQTLIGMAKPWNLKGHNGFLDIVTDTVLLMLGMLLVINLKDL